MRDEYDFSKGKRGAIIPAKGKTRITIYLDDEVLDNFRDRAESKGIGYQTLINQALKTYLQEPNQHPVTESELRRIIREELHQIYGTSENIVSKPALNTDNL